MSECKKCDRIAELEAELEDAHKRIEGWRHRVAEQISRAGKAEARVKIFRDALFDAKAREALAATEMEGIDEAA